MINRIKRLVQSQVLSVFDIAVLNLYRGVFTNIKTGQNLNGIVHQYLKDHCEYSYCTGEMYTRQSMTIKSEGVTRNVPVMYPSGTHIYLYKGAPIVMTPNGKVNDQFHHPSDHQMLIWYVRGTVDIHDLLHKSELYAHARTHRKQNRYCVITFSGTFGETPGGSDHRAPQSVDESVQALSYATPIGVSNDDIQIEEVKQDPFEIVSTCPESEVFRREAKAWLNHKSWYKDRMVPWRYSGFVWGQPGTGKTSTIRALAQELDLPVVTLDLTTMNNTELRYYWRQAKMYAPCIVLNEDVDRLFKETKDLDPERTGISLDVWLNLISGIEDSDGIMTIMTANSLVNIDPALLRPGRTDIAFEVGVLGPEGVRKIATRILKGYEDEIEDVVQKYTGETGATVQRRCQEIALKRLWDRDIELDEASISVGTGMPDAKHARDAREYKSLHTGTTLSSLRAAKFAQGKRGK